MTTLTYNDMVDLSQTLTEMEDLTLPAGHTATLKVYDSAGNHYGTIQKGAKAGAALVLTPNEPVSDDKGWKPGMD